MPRHSKGSHFAPVPEQRPAGKKRRLALAVATAALSLGVVGGTVAWIATHTDPVQNTFTPGQVTAHINDTMANNEKSGVSVTNTGNTDAFVRVAVVATWRDKDNKVYPKAPVAGTDYTVVLGTGWIYDPDSGYYYYTQDLDPFDEQYGGDDTTSVLIESLKPVASAAPADCHLVVDILTEAFQSTPETAVEGAWGIQVDNGVITGV